MTNNPIDLATDEGISQALREISGWGSPVQGSRSLIPPLTTLPSASPPRPRGHRSLVWALAAAVAVLAGTGLFIRRVYSAQEVTASVDLGGGLSQARAIVLCLDVSSEFDLDKLRSEGRFHPFGDPQEGRLVAVIETETLHDSCALARRDDGEWFAAFSLVTAQLDLGKPATGTASNLVRVDDVVGLDAGPLFVGRTSPDVTSIEADYEGDTQAALIGDGWWVAVFDLEAQTLTASPRLTISWTTDTGDEGSTTLNENQSANSWRMCAEEVHCRAGRLNELKELADASPSDLQSRVLADDAVTEDEYRQVMASWGRCIADTTGLKVTPHDDGTFTVYGRTEGSGAAFETCKSQYALAVIEAQALLVWDEPDES